MKYRCLGPGKEGSELGYFAVVSECRKVVFLVSFTGGHVPKNCMRGLRSVTVG